MEQHWCTWYLMQKFLLLGLPWQGKEGRISNQSRSHGSTCWRLHFVLIAKASLYWIKSPVTFHFPPLTTALNGERLEAEEEIFEIRSNVTYGRNKRSFNSSAWRSRYPEFPKGVQERARAQVLRCLGKQMLEWNHSMIGSRKLKLSSRSCTVTEIVHTNI